MTETVCARDLRAGSGILGIVQRSWLWTALGLGALATGGCVTPPHVLLPDEQHVIDRTLVESPEGFEVRRLVTGFTSPTAIALHPDGSYFVAEGERGEEPKIWHFPHNGGRPTLFYPHEQQYIPFRIPKTYWQMYGKIGGMVVVDNEVIVTHRDVNDMGVVTALDPNGGHRTICAGIMAQGDGGLTDITLDPKTHRLYFGCGSVTNSGVVGLDNVTAGWVRDHPDAHDIPLRDLELLGFKFQTVNPMAGFFGPADIAVTAPFQAFAQSSAIRAKGAYDGKPTGAIYSVALDGGFPAVEAWGVHDPRGLAFRPEIPDLYVSIDGMDMRKGCTRPIMNDPDSIITLPGLGPTWLGWPDYSTSFESISDQKYQPPERYIITSGYPQVRQLIDLAGSGLTKPIRDVLLKRALPSLSGANKIAFTPVIGPFSNRNIGNSLIIALSGDRSPWASGGIALPHPVGFKVVCLHLDTMQVTDFVRNSGDLPGSKIDLRNHSLIERPVDLKFGPDNKLYILDEGRMEVRNGHEHFERGSGQIFVVVPLRGEGQKPVAVPETAPSPQ